MRLIDCYAEILSYTRYFMNSLPGNTRSYEEVAKDYQRLIDRSHQLAEEGEYSDKMWRDGFFAIGAWVDESLLCSLWSDRNEWQKFQFQKVYFKTTNAGKEFFERLSKLSTPDGELLEVYEYCLALGFRGMYYDPLDRRKVEEIQLTNLQSLTDSQELEIPESIFPEAYEPDDPSKKANRYQWRKISGFTVAIFILLIGLIVSSFFFFDYLLNAMLVSHFMVK